MNKIFLSASALAMLMGAASCSQEDIQPVKGDGNVNFTIQLPGNQFATRAFSDGKTALDLQYAVYDATTKNFVTEGNAKFPTGELSTTVSLSLANGRSYEIAFFAHDKNQRVYTFSGSGKSVSVAYDKMSAYNATDYDCFYKLEEIGKVTGPINRNVILTRPLAQINWGTNDLADPSVTATDAYGAGAANLVSEVTVKNVYSAFGLLDGKVSGNAADVTFEAKARPAAEMGTFPVENYNYVSMQYVLVDGGENTLIEATLTPSNNSGFTGEPVVVSNLPVQRNFRTNIYGALLTSPAEFTVTKDPIYSTPDNDIEYTYAQVSTADNLLAMIANGGAVQLTADIVIDNDRDLTISKDAIIDLNGHSLKVSGTTANLGSTVIVADGVNVTLKNGTLKRSDKYDSSKSNYGAVVEVKNNSNVVLDNITITDGTPVIVRGNNSNVTINSGTYTTKEGSQAVYVNGTGSKVTINGGTFGAEFTDANDKKYTEFVLNLKDALLKNNPTAKATDFIEVKGGKFINYNPAQSKSEVPTANFVAVGFESVNDGNGNYTVKEYAGEVIDPIVTADGNVQINSAGQLAGFSKKVKDGETYEGKTITLTTDIDLRNQKFQPIGDYIKGNLKPFKGIFDGNGHTIKNLNVEVTDYKRGAGLFGYVQVGTIKNLTIENGSVSGTAYTGGLIGLAYKENSNYVTVENVTVKGVKVLSVPAKGSDNKFDGGNNVGGLIGLTQYGMSVKNCKVVNCTVTGYAKVGGMFGIACNKNTTQGNYTVYENNSVVNTTVNQSKENAYEETLPTTIGAIYGTLGPNDPNLPASNTASNVTVNKAE